MLELDSNLSAIQMLFKYVNTTLVIAAYLRDCYLVSVVARVHNNGVWGNDQVFGCEVSHIKYTAVLFQDC